MQATSVFQNILIEKEPVLGLLSITGFTETNLTGVTGTKFFVKTFRYAIDGINFSNWLPLTNLALTSLTFQPYNIFIIEFNYQRQGTDTTGILNIDDVNITGTYETLTSGPYYKKSIFNRFFQNTDLEVLSWSVNVLQKIYHPGLLAKYIVRGQNNNINGEDEDFIAYWFTVAQFYSFFVTYARLFQDFPNYIYILQEYLRQQNVFFSQDDTLDDLNIIMNNYYHEISERGTIQIIKQKGVNGALVNGEFLRLINYKSIDEFLFTLTPKHKFGWNLGNSSPIYKGVNRQPRIIKGYESSLYPVDITKYPLVNSSNVSISSTIVNAGPFNQIFEYEFNNNGNGNSIIIQGVTSGNIAGIGGITNLSKAITINSNIDYEISCFISQNINSNDITFGIIGLDINNNPINLTSIKTGYDNNYFFQRHNLNIPNTYYRLKGIIYNQNQPLLPNNSNLNIGFGTNLKFKSNIIKIIPVLLYDNTLSANIGNDIISLYGFCVKPLRTNYSIGFIQSNHLIQTWIKNNNTNYSIEDLSEIIRKYLIPYNSWIIINDLTNSLENILDITTTTTLPPLGWKPLGISCE